MRVYCIIVVAFVCYKKLCFLMYAPLQILLVVSLVVAVVGTFTLMSDGYSGIAVWREREARKWVAESGKATDTISLVRSSYTYTSCRTHQGKEKEPHEFVICSLRVRLVYTYYK